jgi:NAD/NADP transhydrogenase alpha subunit
MPSDASNFFARNVMNFLMLMLERANNEWQFKDYLAEEITHMTLITHQGEVRFEEAKMAKKKEAG